MKPIGKKSTKKPPKKAGLSLRKKRKFKRRGKFFVYIVECCDGTFYTGYTPYLKKRVAVHNSGRGARYTRARRPVKLVWHKKFRYFKLAFLEEIRIKKLNRKQKERLMRRG